MKSKERDILPEHRETSFVGAPLELREPPNVNTYRFRKTLTDVPIRTVTARDQDTLQKTRRVRPRGEGLGNKYFQPVGTFTKVTDRNHVF